MLLSTEFTPDGADIYFNSSRSGRMQIWRMRPDGSEQQHHAIVAAGIAMPPSLTARLS